MIGEAINHSPLRLMHSARANFNKAEKCYQICYNSKDANQIFDLFTSRFRLHKSVYNHKTAKAIEYMIIDALLAAEPVLKFVHHIDDPKKYLYLTDHIMSEILSSDKPELAESQRILNRILKRDLYRCVDYRVIDLPDQHIFRDNVSSKEILLESVRALGTTSGPFSSELQESDIIVKFIEMHHGKEEKNPLDFMTFYTKHEPHACEPPGQGCYSNLRPQYFSEILLRVYTKKAEYAQIVKKGYRKILNRLQNQDDSKMGSPLPDAEEGSGSAVPTLPVTEAPTSPKASASGLHARHPSFTKDPSPAPGKRKRPVEARRDEGNPRKVKKKKK